MSEEKVSAYFLGPKSENEYFMREQVQVLLDCWFRWRKDLFVDDPAAITPSLLKDPEFRSMQTDLKQSLAILAERLTAETPKYTPRYLGHMVSELSLPALLGHFAALLHNPNNTSAEVARVGLLLEKEAIEMLARLVGYDPNRVKGHFTSGGTVANFEAVWRARFRIDHWLSLALYLAKRHDRPINLFSDCLMGWNKFHNLTAKYQIDLTDLREFSPVANNPWKISSLIAELTNKQYTGPIMLIPGNKHFSWQKSCNVFGLGEESMWSIPLNAKGQIDTTQLKKLIEDAQKANRPILMIVTVAGTTEAGEIDCVDKVQNIINEIQTTQEIHLWHHVDAAYGGFMASLCHHPKIAESVASNEQINALQTIGLANSLTLDPHKLGYIPYSCGAFLARDDENYTVSQFNAPYLKRTDLQTSKWSATLEGSRTAAGAAATWLTGKTIGFSSEKFSQLIANTFEARRDFREYILKECKSIHALDIQETNIFCFSVANESESLTSANKKTLALFQKLADSSEFAVSKTTFYKANYQKLIEKHVTSYNGIVDCDELHLIRTVFMNPFWSNEMLATKLRKDFARLLKHSVSNT